MTAHHPLDPDLLCKAAQTAGGIVRAAADGHMAFEWRGHPCAFVLVLAGQLTVRFRTRNRQIEWAECRARPGQDCMPVTAAILANRPITARAICAGPCRWIELPSEALLPLIHTNCGFRRALFAAHAQRLPPFFARVAVQNPASLDLRLADWLLGHADRGKVIATHAEIASDLLTSREVVSRKLRRFAVRGWISQDRGCIHLDAPAALARLSRGRFDLPAAGHPCPL